MVAGGFDYLVKARVAGMEAYRQFLSEVILPFPECGKPHICSHGRSKKCGAATGIT
jgi:Lrp/AsnC family leucine-responsive transcriptional regulator